MIVRLEHLGGVTGFGPRPGLCRRGAREWAARYGIDWDAFRRGGIDAEVLLATGDAFAIAVVEHARAQEASLGQ